MELPEGLVWECVCEGWGGWVDVYCVNMYVDDFYSSPCLRPCPFMTWQ